MTSRAMMILLLWQNDILLYVCFVYIRTVGTALELRRRINDLIRDKV